MQQADDLKVTCLLKSKFIYSILEVYLHRLKDPELRVQFVTSYALPNQKEINARRSGNCNYYKDESGARFQRFPNQEQNQLFYLKRPETKKVEINVPSIKKPTIPRDMRENRNCLVKKSEESARLCLPCSELGVPVIRQQELRGPGEHDLIPWQNMPDELRLEIPPEDFLVEITAPPFVDFDQQVSQTKNRRPKSANVTIPGMRARRCPAADSLQTGQLPFRRQKDPKTKRSASQKLEKRRYGLGTRRKSRAFEIRLCLQSQFGKRGKLEARTGWKHGDICGNPGSNVDSRSWKKLQNAIRAKSRRRSAS